MTKDKIENNMRKETLEKESNKQFTTENRKKME